MALTEVDAARLNDNVFNAVGPFKNRIINGDMRIDQRNAGAAVTANDSLPVDRFRLSFANSTGAFSGQQTATAPTGFVNSLKYTTTTADASLGATEYAILYQAIEGLNVADLAWGTASAASVTLSFWCRSSQTGTFGGSLRNSGGSRSYPFSYTINSANTWEYKTITIAGDTSGTWLTTNGVGVYVTLGMGVGSTLSGTAGAWAAANYLSATGAVNLIATLNADFYVTGVQLEAGTTSTPFERRSYGTELSLCQRYYYRIGGNSEVGSAPYAIFASGMLWNTGSGDFSVPLKVGMRSAPAISYGGNVGVQYQSTLANVTSQSTVDGTTKNVAFLRMNTAQSWAAGPGCSLGANNDATAFVAFSSEL